MSVCLSVRSLEERLRYVRDCVMGHLERKRVDCAFVVARGATGRGRERVLHFTVTSLLSG